MRPSPSRLAGASAGLFVCALFLGCDSSDSPPAAPAPPTPVPDPTPPAGVPPLASTIIDISDGHDVGTPYWPDGDTSSGGAGQEVQGIACADADETFHEHSHLSIFLNGEQLAVPSDIGVVEPNPTDTCYYGLHTHDLSGKLHAEGPVPRVYTLGQLFAIWGQPLERNNVAGHTGLPVVVYVTDEGDTAASLYEGDLAAIELPSHREITIQIGTALTAVPRYTWVGD